MLSRRQVRLVVDLTNNSFELQKHDTFPGEIHRIVEQIDDDLAYPGDVAADAITYEEPR